MNLTFYIAVLASCTAVFFMIMFLWSKRKLKEMSCEAKFKNVQRAILEIMEQYLKGGVKVEKMYQFLLEKAVASIPQAQAGSVLIKRNNEYVYVAALAYDLERLSQLTYNEEEIRLWTRGKTSINRKNDVIRLDEGFLDKERLRIIKEFGKLDEIKCNVNFAVEVGNELVALFNIDNFESEDAFDEETLAFAQLFALHLGTIFERDRLEEKLEEERRILEHLSAHDPLTTLMNRRALTKYAEKILSLAKRQGKEIAVMFIDLREFKQLNDAYGHTTGDNALKVIAERLKKSVRQEDAVARIGGDEFIVVAYDCGKEQAEKLANRIVNVVEEPIKENGKTIKLSCNIGVAFYPKDGQVLDQLMQAADMAMYKTKNHGLTVAFFE